MRAENWPKRLDDAVREAAEKPFAWGEHDCCLMAADIIYAITAEDPAADLRGTYSTQEEAAAIILAAGGLSKLANDRCAARGWMRTKPALARRGDLVMLIQPETEGPALGICLGRDAVFPKVGGGLGYIPTLKCVSAWRID